MKKTSPGTGTIIGAFFDDPGQDDYPFNGPFYRNVYTELQQSLEARGATLLILRSQESYLGKNRFKNAWRFEGSDHDLIPVAGPVMVDVIWNKGHLKSAKGDCIVNDPALDDLCTDKWESYLLLKDIHPVTFLLKTVEDLPAALAGIEAPIVVAKPLDLEGGSGVFIGPKAEVSAKITRFPYLLQAFVDTSGGIPGIVEGMHDFRIISLGGDVSLCNIRTPPPNEMTANVSRGGREFEVSPESIPKEALAIFNAVEEKLSRFKNRLYTADMGLDRDGQWKLFEINSKPGFSPKETGPNTAMFHEKLADFLVNASHSSR